MSGAVSGPRLPSPIHSHRSSVSLDSAGAAGAHTDVISDAARARATLARIRDMVNSSLEAFGGVDGDTDASTKIGIDDSGSSYEALKSLYALDSPPRRQLPRVEQPTMLAPFASTGAVMATSEPFCSKDRPRPRSIDAPIQASSAFRASDETAALAALREGIERSLALLPSSVDIIRSCSVSDGPRAGSALVSKTRTEAPLALGDGRHQVEGISGRHTEIFAGRQIEGVAGAIISSVRGEQTAAAAAAATGSSLDMSRTSSLAAPSQLLAIDASFRHERDADITRLEDRIELLFAQVRDAERRACAAAADAQEALRLGSRAAALSKPASPRSSPQRAQLDRPSPLRQTPPSPQANSPSLARYRDAVVVENETLHTTTTGGAGSVAAATHAPMLPPSRPDEISMFLEADMAHVAAEWLAGGPSPRSARAAAQRAADARRSANPPRPPQKQELQCDRPSVPLVRRPWRGVRHGSWAPSRWSREVDSVGGRGLEGAAPPLVRRKNK
jgi:hypothetical protein